jgi:hypothetical protein
MYGIHNDACRLLRGKSFVDNSKVCEKLAVHRPRLQIQLSKKSADPLIASSVNKLA